MSHSIELHFDICFPSTFEMSHVSYSSFHGLCWEVSRQSCCLGFVILKLTFMTPLEIYLLMDLFLCVFGVSLLYEIFGVCGSIFVVTAMGAPLSLSW